MSRAEWNWGMNSASPFQNSVSTSGPSNSSKPSEPSLSLSRSRNAQYGLPLPAVTRVGGTSMLYRRNCTVFQAPVFSISGVRAPASSPLTPRCSSPARTSAAAGWTAQVPSSRSTRRNTPPAPRFFARESTMAFSAGRETASSDPSCAARTRSALVAATRAGGAPMSVARFSASRRTAPSFVSAPNADPTSFGSRPRSAAISGSVRAPCSASRRRMRSSGVPAASQSRPRSVSS